LPASLCVCRSTALRQRVLRPQLKRDPLGSTHMTAQGPSGFNELDRVQVVRLRHPTREVGGTERVRRQPRVGDFGTVVSLLHRGSDPPAYYVECVDDDGLTVWLTEFDRDELTLAPERAA